jgi:transglutaminase-like putative cysteine protease
MNTAQATELPSPESDDIGRYLEDTITIDWQSPLVMSTAKQLLKEHSAPEDRIRRLFEFVRDDIDHAFDIESDVLTCRASEVLKEKVGLCYAKSHLLAGFLRYAGFPAGFCYVRTVDESRPGRFVLHGFNAVYRASTSTWMYLDPRGNREGVETECRFEPPWSLAYWPDVDRGEGFLPFIYKRPGKRIIDLLDRAPSLDAVRNNLPDGI